MGLRKKADNADRLIRRHVEGSRLTKKLGSEMTRRSCNACVVERAGGSSRCASIAVRANVLTSGSGVCLGLDVLRGRENEVNDAVHLRELLGSQNSRDLAKN